MAEKSKAIVYESPDRFLFGKELGVYRDGLSYHVRIIQPVSLTFLGQWPDGTVEEFVWAPREKQNGRQFT